MIISHLTHLAYLATAIQPAGLPQTPANSNTLQHVLEIVFVIIGALAVLMITISGFRYIVSAGDPQRVAKAKDGIIYALVGLIIAIFAESIVVFVVKRL